MADRRIRVLHVINDLGAHARGGAERSLIRLLDSLDPSAFCSRIATLHTGSRHAGDAGEPSAVASPSDSPWLARSWRIGRTGSAGLGLVRELREWKPDVVQAWMYLGNVAASVAQVAALSDAKLIWNIRHSLGPWSEESLSTRVCMGVMKRSQSRVWAAVNNSRRSIGRHRELGLDRCAWQWIGNGFDTGRLSPREGGSKRLRQRLGLPEEAELLGLVGRHHPVKDHRRMLRALAEIQGDYPNLHVVMAGAGVHQDNTELVQEIHRLGVGARVHLLGPIRREIEELYSGLDGLVLCSKSEGFPNVVAEAMACGTPCVVTDVGDAADIVGDTGLLVPASDSADQLGSTIRTFFQRFLRVSDAERMRQRAAARARIVDNYALAETTRRYAELYRRAASGLSPKVDSP